MKILPDLLYRCFLVLILVALSACSPRTKQSNLHQISEADHAPQMEEVSTIVEPEITAQEELAALKQLGVTKEGELAPLPEGLNLSHYDFPVTINKQVLYYLDLFQGKQRKSFTIWLARSTQYIPSIQDEFKKAGLPRDLAYLAMIESGFNPSAYSPAEASGLWQFIAGTGRNHGLKIDTWVDERREPDKATKAAIRYLSKLYKDFDDWYLAVAAYNAGEGRIESACKNYNTENFWEIADSEGIYLETKRYVPKLIAAILIARNPEKFGFTDIKYQKSSPFDVIDVPGGIALEAVAVTANTSVKHLRVLNNELQKNQTPPKQKNYTLRIPAGTKELVASNLDKLHPVTSIAYTTHTVTNGETLTMICSLYNISKTNLLKANNLRTATLTKGRRLQIPVTSTKYVLLKNGEQPEDRLAKAIKDLKEQQQTKEQPQIVRHQMKPGETLAKIAEQYQVPVKNILQWNKLASLSQVKKGQQLTLHLDRRPAPEAMTVKAQATKGTMTVDSGSIPSLEATKKQSVASFPAQRAQTKQGQQIALSLDRSATDTKKVAARVTKVTTVEKREAPPTLEATKKRSIGSASPAPSPQVAVVKPDPKSQPKIWYVVKDGDSLGTIAKRFQISAQDLRQWNNLNGGNLQAGNKLIVKKG
jgi:membrane-bound lytic murein transglycosylase D